jgi:hypothetical protein
MPKFTKKEDELETLFDKWLFVLKNLPNLQNRPKALQERVFQRLFQIAALEKLTPLERRAYDESLKIYWDMNNVIDTAVEEAVMKKEEIIKEKEKALEENAKLLAEKDREIEELKRQLIK